VIESVIRLIILDAGGVLYKGSQRTVEKAVRGFLAKHGIHDFEKSDEIWYKIDKLVTVGKISLREAQERWLEALGLHKDLVDEWNDVDKKEIWGKFRRTPGINRLLAKMKEKYTLVVLSDTIGSKSKKIEEMEIVGVDHRVFDEIFTSHDLGVCKPSKKAFHTVLERFGFNPHETVFVSDGSDELVGAKRIGLVTIGFNCSGGEYSMKKPDEILGILENLNIECAPHESSHERGTRVAYRSQKTTVGTRMRASKQGSFLSTFSEVSHIPLPLLFRGSCSSKL
jgi:FMN phosphatase YigB (HAD superfamily)